MAMPETPHVLRPRLSRRACLSIILNEQFSFPLASGLSLRNGAVVLKSEVLET